MVNNFDTIVCGLGAMGSAAVYQLAKRGNKVLGLDRFSPPHANGSSHGESRIIRQAIGEGEAYVPLVLRSYQLWREIENATGRELLTITGGLTLESQNSEGVLHGRRDFLDQAIRCAETFNIRHEILETADLRKRYPQFAVTDERAYLEYETGFLRPELCIEAQLHLARKHGAEVQTNETIVSVGARADCGVTVKTSRGAYSAEKVIITAGPWIARFLPPAYAPLFKVHRQVMYWFDIREDCRSTFAPPAFPIFIWIFAQGGEFGFYGFPTLDGKTIKIATEQFTMTTNPDHVQRPVSMEEEQSMYKDYVQGRLPGISDRCAAAASCLYTTTPDSNFVIDAHPDNDRIMIASPCSGHGFKHSAAIGEAIAEQVIDGKSQIDLSSFSMKRFKDLIR
ncbi:MAG TPA: N-methyl-L-tryptophan oxidase [Candidatus Binatia bacterium]|nr:N-methyl-L-tryptophan oxidase [Candidatus Binatia bacterium]